jgi:hypothetical protein
MKLNPIHSIELERLNFGPDLLHLSLVSSLVVPRPVNLNFKFQPLSPDHSAHSLILSRTLGVQTPPAFLPSQSYPQNHNQDQPFNTCPSHPNASNIKICPLQLVDTCALQSTPRHNQVGEWAHNNNISSKSPSILPSGACLLLLPVARQPSRISTNVFPLPVENDISCLTDSNKPSLPQSTHPNIQPPLITLSLSLSLSLGSNTTVTYCNSLAC